MSRPTPILVAIAVVVALILAAAASASARVLSGPLHVSPGEVVSYVVGGLRPGQRVSLGVEPTRCGAPTCRYSEGNQLWLAGSDGVARPRFRWPASSARGRTRGETIYSSDTSRARLVAWKRGSLARVTVCAFPVPERCVGRLVRIG